MEMDNQGSGVAAATADANAQEMPAAEMNIGPAQIETLQLQLDEANAKASENLAGWQRERAEFSNYKKRQDQQMADLRAFSTVNLIKRLLPILAPIVLAYIGKQFAGNQAGASTQAAGSGGGLGDVLGSILGGASGGGGGGNNPLGSILGSVLGGQQGGAIGNILGGLLGGKK